MSQISLPYPEYIRQGLRYRLVLPRNCLETVPTNIAEKAPTKTKNLIKTMESTFFISKTQLN